MCDCEEEHHIHLARQVTNERNQEPAWVLDKVVSTRLGSGDGLSASYIGSAMGGTVLGSSGVDSWLGVGSAGNGRKAADFV
ncbi:unnamed protein product [Prunus armeniaca]|uniref:Uncharacterized protein n=1 Tax=Prunus armeniaca TaxID=36596 RepID=A0A6J5XPM4_PRUAR|nr:unnamed protein product [Prunus armeniaca]